MLLLFRLFHVAPVQLSPASWLRVEDEVNCSETRRRASLTRRDWNDWDVLCFLSARSLLATVTVTVSEHCLWTRRRLCLCLWFTQSDSEATCKSIGWAAVSVSWNHPGHCGSCSNGLRLSRCIVCMYLTHISLYIIYELVLLKKWH